MVNWLIFLGQPVTALLIGLGLSFLLPEKFDVEMLSGGGWVGEAIIAAAKEVGPALFYSLLIITLSFLPVFTLQAQEGRLFRPLAFTKTFALIASRTSTFRPDETVIESDFTGLLPWGDDPARKGSRP